MTTDVIMPALSPTMEKGTLARWLVALGTQIKAGDVLAEIETDKASMEVESSEDGVLTEILVPEGTDDVPVGTPIARLSSEPLASLEPVTSDAPEAAAILPLSPSARRAAKAFDVDVSKISGTGRAGRVTKADILKVADEPLLVAEAPRPDVVDDGIDITPLARRFATASTIDLSVFKGDRRIGVGDLLPSRPAPPVPSAARPLEEPIRDSAPSAGAPFEMQKLSAMRRTIARRLSEAKREIPHIYLTVEVRLDALLSLRSELNTAMAARGVKLSINDFLIKAQALALRGVPACNVEFTNDGLKLFSRADISVAVSIPNGLITPVITDAGARTPAAIAIAMRDLAGRAREGKLMPEEYQGGTASLSNLGMFGIKQFEAIINPPQAMILAVGASDRRLDLVDGEVVERTVLNVTGSFDHRAIDGADAAAFMNIFKETVETPMLLLA